MYTDQGGCCERRVSEGVRSHSTLLQATPKHPRKPGTKFLFLFINAHPHGGTSTRCYQHHVCIRKWHSFTHGIVGGYDVGCCFLCPSVHFTFTWGRAVKQSWQKLEPSKKLLPPEEQGRGKRRRHTQAEHGYLRVV